MKMGPGVADSILNCLDLNMIPKETVSHLSHYHITTCSLVVAVCVIGPACLCASIGITMRLTWNSFPECVHAKASMRVSHWIQIAELSSQALHPFPLNKLYQLCHLRRNHLLVESKVLVRVLARQALPKLRHGESRIGVALPSVDGVRLDYDPGSIAPVLQRPALILDGLAVE